MKSESWSTLCKSFLRAPGYLKEEGCGGRREKEGRKEGGKRLERKGRERGRNGGSSSLEGVMMRGDFSECFAGLCEQVLL